MLCFDWFVMHIVRGVLGVVLFLYRHIDDVCLGPIAVHNVAF